MQSLISSQHRTGDLYSYFLFHIFGGQERATGWIQTMGPLRRGHRLYDVQFEQQLMSDALLRKININIFSSTLMDTSCMSV